MGIYMFFLFMCFNIVCCSNQQSIEENNIQKSDIYTNFGLRVANSGLVDIKELHVIYPHGDYKITNLSAKGGTDQRAIVLSGQVIIKLNIIYADGAEVEKVVEVNLPDKPQLFQIAIEDGGQLFYR